MRLAVVIPAYNEATTIGEVVGSLLAVRLPGCETEILVVDDGSTDRTGEIARAAGAVVIRHLINRGLGGALGTGLQAALRRGADVIATFDADGQHASADLAAVVEPIVVGRAEVVIGSRLKNAGTLPAMPLTRRWANQAANLVTRALYGITTSDSQSGLRAFSRPAAERIRIQANQYGVSSEILGEVRRHGLTLTEVPVRAIYTAYSLSKGQGLGMGLKTLLHLLLFGRRRSS
jgi:glycosyltransferase involved in cell wall biosynthesis